MNRFRTLLTRIVLMAAPLLMLMTEDGTAQTFRYRVAQLISDVPTIDAYVNGSTTPYLTDVPYEAQSARSAPFPSPLRVVITRADAGAGSPLIDRTMTLDGDRIYSFLAYGTSAAAKLAVLPWRFDQVPPIDFANVRVFNATTLPGGIDVYFDSTTGLPAMSNLMMDSASQFVTVPARSGSLIITAAGSKTPLARFVAPMANRSVQTFVVTGSGAANLAVYALNENTQAVDQAPMTKLPREQAVGAIPTLRFINAFPQPDARRLDVYTNGSTLAAQGINYRGASGVLPNIGVGDVNVTLVPENRGSADSVYGTTMRLARDTAYALVLTQFRSGAAVALTLTRSISEPMPTAGRAKIRLANVNDFQRDLVFVLVSTDTVAFNQPQFLTVTDFREINAGSYTLQVFRPGTAAPIYQGQYTVVGGSVLTMLAIGDDTRFAVDVLRHHDQGPQNPLESFGAIETSVRELIVSATRSMRLRSVPNPIVGDAHITFELARASSVTVELYDALGRNVLTLASGQFTAGTNSIRLDGGRLAPGTYTCTLRAGATTAAIPVAVVR